MQLFERLCATFLHTMPHLFPPAVSIVVKMSSPHCRMQKEGGILMRLPCNLTLIWLVVLKFFTSLHLKIALVPSKGFDFGDLVNGRR